MREELNRIAEGILELSASERRRWIRLSRCAIRESRRCSFAKRICGLACRLIRRYGGRSAAVTPLRDYLAMEALKQTGSGMIPPPVVCSFSMVELEVEA